MLSPARNWRPVSSVPTRITPPRSRSAQALSTCAVAGKPVSARRRIRCGCKENGMYGFFSRGSVQVLKSTSTGARGAVGVGSGAAVAAGDAASVAASVGRSTVSSAMQALSSSSASARRAIPARRGRQ